MGKIHNFFWESSHPLFTVQDSFLISREVLMVYRFLSLAAMLFIYIWTAVKTHVVFLPMQYLTNWGITAVLLYFVGICACYIVYYNVSGIDRMNPFAYWKFVSVLGEFAFSAQILIPPYYWLLLFTPGGSTTELWINILGHAVTAVLIWVETFFNKNKFYKRHVIIILGLALVYVAVNGIYTGVTGTPVYPNLTWKSWWTLFYLALSTVVASIGFGIGYGLTKWKYRKNSKNSFISDSYNV